MPVAADGTICVQSMNPVDVVVDLTGVFDAAGELRFVPTDPTRMLDTRTATGGWTPYQGSGSGARRARRPARGARRHGHDHARRAAAPRLAQGLPVRDRSRPHRRSTPATETVFANAVTVGVDAGGRMCIKALSATHTLFDVTGWWVP